MRATATAPSCGTMRCHPCRLPGPRHCQPQSHDRLCLAGLPRGREPTSLYLCLQFRDIDRLGVVLGAIVEALIELLGSPERTPRHRTLLLLDELANLGTLSELERGVSYLAGNQVQVLASVQRSAPTGQPVWRTFPVTGVDPHASAFSTARPDDGGVSRTHARDQHRDGAELE